MPEMLTVPLRLGYEVIRSYRRLSYHPWTALAEFVDNSTQSYLLNREALDRAFLEEGASFSVRIEYDRSSSALRIADNAIGMSMAELQHALHIGATPLATTGRARYGMGLKTAACWFGDSWSISTSRLGEPFKYTVTINVEAVASGEKDLAVVVEAVDPNDHFTVIDITALHKPIEPRTRGKVKDYLGSMYRSEIARGDLTLWCFDQNLAWDSSEFSLRLGENGRPLRRQFSFSVDGKKVAGWAGILKNASRAKAGFTIFHSGRVIRGWPDSWRPQAIFGQVQGSNDLVNQRLAGEVDLSEFDVSHTKDDILWYGTEEDEVGDRLLDACVELVRIAKLPIREAGRLTAGRSAQDWRYARSTIQAELVAPETRRILASVPNGDVSRFIASSRSLVDAALDRSPDFTTAFGRRVVSGYLTTDATADAPYAVSTFEDEERLIIVINTNHPYVEELDRTGLLDHLRHTVFGALASWQANAWVSAGLVGDADFLKDALLRVPSTVRSETSSRA